MLSSKEYTEWSQQDHKDRDYQSEEEQRFFEAVENPAPPTQGLKELADSYGKYAFKD